MIPLTLLLAACGPHDDTPLPHQRVVFIGVDGASWTVMGPMIEAGELPAFSRMIEQGAHMARFETMGTTHSPVVWSSVATGRLPEDHGIIDYVETLPGGQKVPVTSNGRKAKALWEITGEHGLRAGVIGWWASWPAEDIDGYVVSDHANPVQAGWMAVDDRYWTADPAQLEALHQDYKPDDLGPTLEKYWLDPDHFPTAEFKRRSGLDDTQVALAVAAPWNDRLPYSWLKTFFGLDYPLFEVAQQLRHDRPTDLQMLYLRGPDPLQHYAWDRVEPDKYRVKPAHLERDRGIVQGVYRYVDSFIGEVMDDLGPETTLIVASDHGGEPCKWARHKKRGERPGCHTVKAKGVLFIYGPHVRARYDIDDANPLDLMPTMAWLLGLPLSKELAGEPIQDAFTRDFVRRRGEQTVDSYGPRPTQAPLPSLHDDTMLRQLEGLGYIDED